MMVSGLVKLMIVIYVSYICVIVTHSLKRNHVLITHQQIRRRLSKNNFPISVTHHGQGQPHVINVSYFYH